MTMPGRMAQCLSLFASVVGEAVGLGAQVVDLRALDLPRWTLEEEVRLGSLDGVNDAFVAPRLLVDASGRLLVADQGRTPSLRLFESEGRFIRQIGSVGEGPGQYLSVTAFGLRGDTVWVSDERTGRVTLFGTDGTLIESRRFSDPAAPDARVPFRMLPSGDFLAVTPSGPRSPRDVEGDGLLRFQQFTVRADPTGAVLDTLMAAEVTHPVLVFNRGGRVLALPFLIRDDVLVNYVPSFDGVREVHRAAPSGGQPAEFRIVERTRAGEVVRERVFRDAPRALAGPVRDSLLEVVANHYEGSPPETVATALRYIDLPQLLPPVTGVSEAEDGTLWVRREAFSGDGVAYLVLDAALNPIATLTLPPAARGLAGPHGSERLWAVVRDEFEVPYLVRYRVGT